MQDWPKNKTKRSKTKGEDDLIIASHKGTKKSESKLSPMDLLIQEEQASMKLCRPTDTKVTSMANKKLLLRSSRANFNFRFGQIEINEDKLFINLGNMCLLNKRIGQNQQISGEIGSIKMSQGRHKGKVYC